MVTPKNAGVTPVGELMRRDQLEHAIRTASQGGKPEVIVGSRSILGPLREEGLSADAPMSVEVDILPIADGYDETTRLSDLIEGSRLVLTVRGTPRLQQRWR
jgi:hypothetical protein